MQVSIFGLGCVGCVSLTCLADQGFPVIGVDINEAKVNLINQGQSPLYEPGLLDVLQRVHRNGLIRATSDARQAVHESDMSWICVGTPDDEQGRMNDAALRAVCSEIGEALAEKDGYHVVVNRSTAPPGTLNDLMIPILEARSSKCAGKDFGVCVNPEFLREGSGVADFYDPPYVLIGTNDERVVEAMCNVYKRIPVSLIVTTPETAEMVKYASNAFHALKIAFANEIGSLCHSRGVDGAEVMRIISEDRKLNLSPLYLKPGFAFGGSCLPKDLRTLATEVNSHAVSLPLLDSLLASNEQHLQRAYELVMGLEVERIGFVGLAFKQDTDDLRESPAVQLVARLRNSGRKVAVYDRWLDVDSLMGANLSFIQQTLPDLDRLLVSSMEELCAEAQAIVVVNASQFLGDMARHLRDEHILVDLGIRAEIAAMPEHSLRVC